MGRSFARRLGCYDSALERPSRRRHYQCTPPLKLCGSKALIGLWRLQSGLGVWLDGHERRCDDPTVAQLAAGTAATSDRRNSWPQTPFIPLSGTRFSRDGPLHHFDENTQRSALRLIDSVAHETKVSCARRRTADTGADLPSTLFFMCRESAAREISRFPISGFRFPDFPTAQLGHLVARKYTYVEATTMLSNLPFEEKEIYERIKGARKTVLENPDLEVKCYRKTVALEAGLRTSWAVKFMPLIEALELGPRHVNPPNDPANKAPLPELFGDAMDDVTTYIRGFLNGLASKVQDSITKEREQTRSAFEPRTLVAETALRDMTYQRNDFEEAASAVVADYDELSKEHGEAKRYIDKLEGDVTAFQIESSQSNERATQLAEEVRQLRETNLDGQEIHREAIERIRKEHAAALKFEQDRLAALIEAFIRRE